MAQTIKLFKLNSPKDISMVSEEDDNRDTFNKQEFERDLEYFISELIATNDDLYFIKRESPELPKAVEKASLSGIREGVYKTVSDLLGFERNSIPDKFNYHFGDLILYSGINIDKSIYNFLIEDPIVKRDLAWHGVPDLEVNCGDISDTVTTQYCCYLKNKRSIPNLTEEELKRLELYE